ncbi:DHH family phosphoesterase [Bacillus taeanensis]|uniref:Bifunctional oligoribonuclease/PAP phosphatase NrnA n=1 Tax=Bacillus taeanensis TaxID=273032 RepID=A0A366XZW3_9BACI|nr:bifunctional oligoribonuclease/PAP phosphatase NrnA [Bacillus taeanensis]RBW71477.1 bifunctional oligoribonuclease/PAP phosphatase NrnA [Bacillus taeanensis]
MKSRILDTIESYHTIIIHRHVRPDPDALGSQGGLSEILKASYPEKKVYIVGEEDEGLTFLCKMDEIPDAVYEGALVIVCDTANQPRVSDQRYKLGEKVIKIDHHPNEDPYGDMIWVDTSASSVSEMIYDFYLSQKEHGLIMNKRAARLLYAGIIGDTGRFLFSNTTEKTFQYAGELIHTGIEFREIYESLYKKKLELIHLNGYVLQNFTLTEAGAGYIKVTQEVLNQFGVVPSEASLLVNAFSKVEGIKAWVFFIEEKDQIRVRLRSKGPIVNTIAAYYEGGGHPMAAGATIYKWEQAEDVLRDLEEVCRSYS